MSDEARRILQLEQRLGRLPLPIAGATPYVLPALQVAAFAWASGWGDYGSTFAAVRCTKDAIGVVRLEGLAKRSSGAVTTILTLPQGFRPAASRMFAVMSDPNALGRVDVAADGAVTLQLGGAGAVALDGLSWLAA